MKKRTVRVMPAQGLYLGLFAGLLALALWPVAAPLFQSMKHSPDKGHRCTGFFKIRLWVFAQCTGHRPGRIFLQAINRPRVPMYVAIVGTALNALLNYLLIFGKWGSLRWGQWFRHGHGGNAQYFQAALLHLVFMYAPSLKDMGTRRVVSRI